MEPLADTPPGDSPALAREDQRAHLIDATVQALNTQWRQSGLSTEDSRIAEAIVHGVLRRAGDLELLSTCSQLLPPPARHALLQDAANLFQCRTKRDSDPTLALRNAIADTRILYPSIMRPPNAHRQQGPGRRASRSNDAAAFTPVAQPWPIQFLESSLPSGLPRQQATTQTAQDNRRQTSSRSPRRRGGPPRRRPPRTAFSAEPPTPPHLPTQEESTHQLEEDAH